MKTEAQRGGVTPLGSYSVWMPELGRKPSIPSLELLPLPTLYLLPSRHAMLPGHPERTCRLRNRNVESGQAREAVFPSWDKEEFVLEMRNGS